MPLRALSDQWVMVASGTFGIAEMYAEDLRAHGVPVFTPDRNMKVLAPSDVGGLIFDMKVLVPHAEFERAREILGFVPSDAPGEPAAIDDEVALNAGAVDEDVPPSAAEIRLQRLRDRICWSAFVPFLGPYGLWLAIRSARDSTRLPEPHPSHAMAAIATLLCAGQTALLVNIIAVTWLRL